MTLDVRVLYTEGCANTAPTIQRVQDVAREMGITIQVDQVLVTTQDQANVLRFLGSPTVQINGQDIDPAARKATAFGFPCRNYGASGMPSIELVQAALREAVEHK
jgi:hypothetical protein